MFRNGHYQEALPYKDRQGHQQQPQPWVLIAWGSGVPREIIESEIAKLRAKPELQIESAEPIQGAGGGAGGGGGGRRIKTKSGEPLLRAFLLFGDRKYQLSRTLSTLQMNIINLDSRLA